MVCNENQGAFQKWNVVVVVLRVIFVCSAAKLCGEILQRKWTLCEQTSVRKEATEYLLKYHLEWATEPLYLIDLICGEAAVELIGDQAVEESTKYPTLSRCVIQIHNYCNCK